MQRIPAKWQRRLCRLPRRLKWRENWRQSASLPEETALPEAVEVGGAYLGLRFGLWASFSGRRLTALPVMPG